MLIAAALVLFTVLCIALSDDLAWDNLTRSTRNALVFQERHQGYGAFVLRREYDRRFIVAFFGALGLLAGILGLAAMLAGRVDATGVAHRSLSAREYVVPLVEPSAASQKKAVEQPRTHPQPSKPSTPTTALVEAGPKEQKSTNTVVDSLPSTPTLPGGDPGGTAPKGPGGDPSGGTSTTLLQPKTIRKQFEVDVLPEFPGGEVAMHHWVQDNVRFPEDAQEKDRVYVEFVVNEDGSISAIRAIRGKHPAFMREAERLVRKMPKWKAAKAQGEDVPCLLVLPISFETK